MIHLRPRRSRAPQPVAAPAQDWGGDGHPLFGRRAILRSLVMFNGLFALQTAMDLLYLWGGAALPDGMTLASYAHRGAYPLIVTALLAAGFVLAAARPGGPAEKSPLIKTLILAWVGQNVLLVLSSILRLDLYVAVFSLTAWRVAAFLWMLLVAVGLVLILVKIARGKSNEWLIGANAAALAAMLYACCFLNFSYIIADYNLSHAREVSGEGVPLDVSYLCELGPQAVPAIDARPELLRANDGLTRVRDTLARRASKEAPDWREWTFRTQRLDRYLSHAPMPSTPASSRYCYDW